MVIARRLLIGGGGSFIAPLTNLYGLFNGHAVAGVADYAIGYFTSSNGGNTFTIGASPVISAAGSGWRSLYLKDPWVVHDGSTVVCYVTGWGATGPQIGRFTNPNVGADPANWTEYGSNPVIAFGAGGTFDEDGAIFASVLHEPSESPPWKMWYTGFPNGSNPSNPTGVSIGYADSTNGLTWTKRGQVLPLGTSGQQDDAGLVMGGALRVGSIYYIYYGGFRSDFFERSMVATCTDPANSATYTRLGVLSGFSGTFTFAGLTWRSNQPRHVIPSGSGYRMLGDVWSPSTGAAKEGAFSVEGSSPISFTPPTALMIPLGSGWYANSAENPTAIPS